MMIVASLKFGQNNICGQLKLFAICSAVFEVDRCTKCHKEARISSVTEKKLRLQIAGVVGNVYELTRLVHVTSRCCKWLPQRKLRNVLWILDLHFDIVSLLNCVSP